MDGPKGDVFFCLAGMGKSLGVRGLTTIPDCDRCPARQEFRDANHVKEVMARRQKEQCKPPKSCKHLLKRARDEEGKVKTHFKQTG
jgi:hypothetical protein